MSTYKTGNPLGSAAVKDLYDNAENLDFALNSMTALIWTDRLGKTRPSFFGMETSFLNQMVGHESAFEAAQADKETRFQQFLLSSGYVFLGDYEGGPFQFSARNQYIRYNNQYYRLNAATDVGFTTTGTTAASFENDVTHFVLMDGDALRQDLGSNKTGLGAALVVTEDTETVQEKIHKIHVGTNALRDSVASGVLDVLLNSTIAGAVALNLKKFVMPNGNFSATRWFRNRGTPATVDTSGLDNFSIIGQGSSNTVLKHPGATGFGDHMFFDKAKNGKIGGFTLDNTALESAGRNQNGQMWVTGSRDLEFEDIRFRGGDQLTFALSGCVNVVSRDMKVDFQYRYTTGTGKSPLIVGDFSQQCMFLGGYIKSVSDDGTVKYSGDLGDNDDATDTKWAFTNFYGLTYSQRSNANACLWQEGENARSNLHAIGNNYVGNGFGRGISQLAIGTDVACSFNANQRAGIWARAQYWNTIGCHFLDITNPQGLSNGNGAIWNESMGYIASIGSIFSGNTVDYTNYGSGSYTYGCGYFSLGDCFSGLITQPAGATSKAQHQSWVASRLAPTSKFKLGASGVHNVILGSQSKDVLGEFGHGSDTTNSQINDIAFASINGDTNKLTTEDGAVIPLVQTGYGRVNTFKSVITGFRIGIATYGSGTVVYEQCTFIGCNFSAADLSSGKFINCTFIDCNNSPANQGLNFKCDSAMRPASARCDVTVVAGGTYTFPSWVLEDRGIYTIKVGGRGANAPYAEMRIARASATSAVTSTAIIESTAGSITAAWPASGQPTITFAVAGTYTIKLG